MTTRRTALTVLAAGATAVALAACSGNAGKSDTSDSASGGGDLTKVKLQLQWVPQAQFAGYYVAASKGYYKDEGLDVDIMEAGTDTVPITVLAQGNADYAISWVPKVLGSIEQGTDVTDVAQIFERSGTTQISFKDKNITKPADLAGKKVGSWGYGNEWELFAGMNKDGVSLKDIKLVQQAFDMKGFLSGDIDAAQAMTYNEYAQVLETKNPKTGELYQPSDLNVINWNDVGTAMLQDAIWADAGKLKSDTAYADTTVKFIKASLKGWVYTRDHPDEAAQIVADAGSTLPAGHQLWMANEVNKLIWPSTSGIGHVNEDQWKQTVDIALKTSNEKDEKIITKEPPSTAYSNEYVDKALAELKDEGVDVMGSGFQPQTVTLKEGGK